MSEPPPDDARLRATEAQMRQALGLRGDTWSRPAPDHSTTSNSGSHPQRRRFVRDGEVPVTLVHREHRHDDPTGSNQLEAAREALHAQTVAREHAERLLGEAQNTIRDLQTKLAHERLARDEAVQAVRQTLHTVQEDLSAERLARLKSETDLATAVEAHRIAEQRLEDAIEQAARRPSKQLPRRRAAIELDADGPTVADDGGVKPARRRGAPANVDDQKSDVVEWWKPGWQKKFR